VRPPGTHRRMLSRVSPDGVRVAFQLDRFEQTGEDRLEVAGRWYGVRGLRFVRPALTVQTNDGERNLLALLEHKPWAVEEGESWIAAFPWEGESPDPDMAELAVAPSVVVALVRDGGGQATAPTKPNAREQLQESETRARRLESEVAWLREGREALLADKRAAEEEAAGLRSDLREAHSVNEAAVGERDAAAQERDDAVHQRDAAVTERDQVLHAREEIGAERDRAVAERDAAVAARDAALSELEDAQRERAEAVAAREAIVAERDEAVETSKRALAERDAALGRGSGFPAVSAADLARQPHQPAPGPARDRVVADWTARAIAGGALFVLLVVVIVLLRFL
jgi:outer membrane murein-binding lipoprotein Lpp